MPQALYQLLTHIPSPNVQLDSLKDYYYYYISMCAYKWAGVCTCVHTEARRRYQETKISAYSFQIKPLLNLRLMSSCQAGSQQDSKVLFVCIPFGAGVTSVHSFVMWGLQYNPGSGTLNHWSISLAPIWNTLMSLYDLHRSQHCLYLSWSKILSVLATMPPRHPRYQGRAA